MVFNDFKGAFIDPGADIDDIATLTFDTLNLAMTDTTTYLTDIGGASANDRVNVTGNVTLGGTLDVDLINSFSTAIQINDEFSVVTTTGAISGEFDTINFDDAALKSGMQWEVEYTSTDVILRVVSAGPNEILNGSFEDDVVTANGGNWELFSSIEHWSRDSGADVELQRNLFGGAAEMQQHAELDGTGNTAISQVVPTTAGETYTLSFAFRGRPNTNEANNVLDVQVRDVGGDLLVRDLISDTDNGWTYYNYTFTADGSLTEVAFADVGVSNGSGTFLDHVYLSKTSDSLPDAPNPVPSNLIVNGSFEQLTVTANSGQWQLFSQIPGWTLNVGTQFELQRGILGGASEGAQHAELGSTSNTTISQEIDTEAGADYELIFAFAGRPGTGVAENELDVNVIDVGSSATLFTQNLSTAPNGWSVYTYTFQATGSQTKISFADQGTDNSLGTFFDDVSVTKLATASAASSAPMEANATAVSPLEILFAGEARESLRDSGKAKSPEKVIANMFSQIDETLITDDLVADVARQYRERDEWSSERRLGGANEPELQEAIADSVGQWFDDDVV